MENVELKVNAINQLKLLRMSTFKDKLCFLDEDIQNAQRAKAKNFKVTLDRCDNKIIIEDDGCGIDDPQCLFSIAESGWDEDIKNTENPFGTGFFSNITVSNYIEIFSHKKHIIFDVDKMIKTQDTNVFTEEVEEEYDGFKMILHNINFSEIYSWDIEERVKQLGKYVHDIDVFYNGSLIEKKTLTEGDNSRFKISVKDDNFQGWLAIKNGYGSNSKINIYYKGRLVTNLDSLYIKGDIHINDKTLNLTAPDRKDIIRDSKLSEFRVLLNLYIEEMCNKAILENDADDIQDYINGINYYIDKNKIKKMVKFATFKSQNDKDFEYLKGICTAKIKNQEVNSFKEYMLYLEKEASKNNEKNREIDVELKTLTKPKNATGVVVHEDRWIDGDSGSFKKGYTEYPKIDDNDLVEKIGEMLVVSDEPTFWLSFNDIVNNEYKLNIAKHYNLRIIVARNRIEEELLKSMKDTDNVLHISELKENVIVKATISNTDLSIEEQRALMILNMISIQILGKEKNLFNIGDLMVSKIIEVESIGSKNELIEDGITIVADINNKQVYLDRKTLINNNLTKSLNEDLDLNDYKFILRNINNICKELNMLNIGMSEEQIKNKIIEALGGAI